MSEYTLSGFEIGLSGAVPERALGSDDTVDREILQFVENFCALVFKAGGRIVHGSHPVFSPVILEQARIHATQQRVLPPVTLVQSGLWTPDNALRSRYAQQALFATVPAVGQGTENDPQTRNASLTAMRTELVQRMNVLVAVGGKLHEQDALAPGVDEEIKLAQRRGLACFLVGIGGRTSAIAKDRENTLLQNLRNSLPDEENQRLITATQASTCPELICNHLARNPQIAHRSFESLLDPQIRPGPAMPLALTRKETHWLGAWLLLQQFICLVILLLIWPDSTTPVTATISMPATAPAGTPATAPAGTPATAPAGTPATAPAGTPATAPAGTPATASAGTSVTAIISAPAGPAVTEATLVKIVLCMGAIGSLLHALVSFADYVGNRQLVRSWLWWYIVRPFLGAPLALLFYLVLRAGILSSTTAANVYVAALSGALAGLFSKKALDKLGEWFEIIFHTKEERKDALSTQQVTLTKVTPDRLKSATAMDITVTGSGFTGSPQVTINSVPLVTTLKSPTELTAKLTSEILSGSGRAKIQVIDKGTGTQSNELQIDYEE